MLHPPSSPHIPSVPFSPPLSPSNHPAHPLLPPPLLITHPLSAPSHFRMPFQPHQQQQQQQHQQHQQQQPLSQSIQSQSLQHPLPHPRFTSLPPRGTQFVVERFGRFSRILRSDRGPPLLPLFDRVVAAYSSHRVARTTPLAGLIVVLADNSSLNIAASWSVKVVDACTLAYKTHDVDRCVDMLVHVRLRDAFANLTAANIPTSSMAHLENCIKDSINETSQRFGVVCKAFNILSITPVEQKRETRRTRHFAFSNSMPDLSASCEIMPELPTYNAANLTHAPFTNIPSRRNPPLRRSSSAITKKPIKYPQPTTTIAYPQPPVQTSTLSAQKIPNLADLRRSAPPPIDADTIASSVSADKGEEEGAEGETKERALKMLPPPPQRNAPVEKLMSDLSDNLRNENGRVDEKEARKENENALPLIPMFPRASSLIESVAVKPQSNALQLDNDVSEAVDRAVRLSADDDEHVSDDPSAPISNVADIVPRVGNEPGDFSRTKGVAAASSDFEKPRQEEEEKEEVLDTFASNQPLLQLIETRAHIQAVPDTYSQDAQTETETVASHSVPSPPISETDASHALSSQPGSETEGPIVGEHAHEHDESVLDLSSPPPTSSVENRSVREMSPIALPNAVAATAVAAVATAAISAVATSSGANVKAPRESSISDHPEASDATKDTSPNPPARQVLYAPPPSPRRSTIASAESEKALIEKTLAEALLSHSESPLSISREPVVLSSSIVDEDTAPLAKLFQALSPSQGVQPQPSKDEFLGGGIEKSLRTRDLPSSEQAQINFPATFRNERAPSSDALGVCRATAAAMLAMQLPNLSSATSAESDPIEKPKEPVGHVREQNPLIFTGEEDVDYSKNPFVSPPVSANPEVKSATVIPAPRDEWFSPLESPRESPRASEEEGPGDRGELRYPISPHPTHRSSAVASALQQETELEDRVKVAVSIPSSDFIEKDIESEDKVPKHSGPQTAALPSSSRARAERVFKSAGVTPSNEQGDDSMRHPQTQSSSTSSPSDIATSSKGSRFIPEIATAAAVTATAAVAAMGVAETLSQAMRDATNGTRTVEKKSGSLRDDGWDEVGTNESVRQSGRRSPVRPMERGEAKPLVGSHERDLSVKSDRSSRAASDPSKTRKRERPAVEEDDGDSSEVGSTDMWVDDDSDNERARFTDEALEKAISSDRRRKASGSSSRSRNRRRQTRRVTSSRYYEDFSSDDDEELCEECNSVHHHEGYDGLESSSTRSGRSRSRSRSHREASSASKDEYSLERKSSRSRSSRDRKVSTERSDDGSRSERGVSRERSRGRSSSRDRKHDRELSSRVRGKGRDEKRPKSRSSSKKSSHEDSERRRKESKRSKHRRQRETVIDPSRYAHVDKSIKSIYRHRQPESDSGPENPIPWYCEGQSAPEDTDSDDIDVRLDRERISRSRKPVYSSYGQRNRYGHRTRAQHNRSVRFAHHHL